MRTPNGESFASLENVAKALGLTAKVNGKTFDKPYEVAVILYHRNCRVIQKVEKKDADAIAKEKAKQAAVLEAAGIAA